MLNNKTKKLICALLLLIGSAIFIVLGTISIKEIREFRQTPAVVSHIEREWTPNGDGTDTENVKIFVTYTVDGQAYTEELQNTKTNYSQGDQITVLYNPDDPTVVSGATKGIAAIQFAVGGVLALAGVGSLVVTLVKGREV